MCWISKNNNIKIDIYEHQIDNHICLCITVVHPSSPHLLPPKNTLDLLAALFNGLCPQSSALPPMLPVPAWPQLSTVSLVGRARNPSKLTVWCIFSGSGLSCRRAKCARLTQRSLAPYRQQLPYRCEGSPWQCAAIYPRIRSAACWPAKEHFDTCALARRLELVSARFGQSDCRIPTVSASAAGSREPERF